MSAHSEGGAVALKNSSHRFTLIVAVVLYNGQFCISRLRTLWHTPTSQPKEVVVEVVKDVEEVEDVVVDFVDIVVEVVEEVVFGVGLG